MTEIKIDKRRIGDNYPAFIVAELSGNHNNDFNLAVKTIKAIKEAGADAVKIQTYTPDTITLDCDNKYFKITQGTIWDGITLYKLYQKIYTPWDWQPKLKKAAEDLGLIFFSSPFDETAVDFLEKIDVPAYKLGSNEIVDTPLIRYIATKGKPILISTGIARLADIKLAVQTYRRAGNNQIALLKCTAAYPAPLEELNLKTIIDLKKRFKTVVGLSDHSLSIDTAVVAICLGAKIVEKHFIIDRKLGGPDSSFSLEPKEFKRMVESIRKAEKMLGKINYELTPNMKKHRQHAASIIVMKDIKKGDKFDIKNIKTIRPGFGLHPKYWDKVIGKKAKKDIKRGTPLKWQLVD